MGRTSRTTDQQETTLSPAAVRLLDAFEARIGQTAEDAYAAMLAEIPSYGRVKEPGFKDELITALTTNLTNATRILRSGRPATREDLVYIRAPTMRRAQRRIPLGDYLHAFRIGHRFAWRSFLESADDPDRRDAALALGEPLIEVVNMLSTHAAEVFVEIETLLLAEGERVRRDVLDDLLAGRPVRHGAATDALAAAGLVPDTRIAVLSALAVGGSADEHTLRAAATALGRVRPGPTSPLSVQRGDEIITVLPADQTDGATLAGALRGACEKLAEQGVHLRIGVSTIVDAVEQAPTAYREASAARALADDRDPVMAFCELGVFDYLTLVGDDTALRLVAPEVASFVRDDLAAGGVLTATLREYADTNLNAKAAAQRLFIHVNTAHYRLARIGERTGRDLRNLGDVVELLIAVNLASVRKPSG